jgi:nucleoside-diphosphate-sugar epimerase
VHRPQLHETVLVTGGAGFIGSHLADELLAHGFRVRAFDSLVDQVHSNGSRSSATRRMGRPSMSPKTTSTVRPPELAVRGLTR